jgi:hypothetical protein
VLKDENSLSWSTHLMAGAGMPGQYDAAVTPILLNKRIKMVNSLRFNNSGMDYRNDLKQLGSSNFIAAISNAPAQIPLSLATIGPPDLPLTRYYFNHSGIINLNNVYTTAKGVQFKANVQGYIDKNSLTYHSRVENYLPDDTVVYREQQSYENRPLLLNGSFNVQVNRKGYFFNNHFTFQLSKERNTSFMDFNDYSFGQSVHKNAGEFSNDLNWIPALKGKGIGEVRWLISYKWDKQLLDIGRGYYSDILHQEGFYDHVFQRLKIPTLLSHVYFAYKIPGRILLQEYKAGFIGTSRQLNTSLDFIRNEQSSPYTGDAGNDLTWRQYNAYFSTEFQFKYQQFQSTVQLPVSYQHIHYAEPAYQLNAHNTNLLFNPAVLIRYNINPEQSLSARYKFSNGFGDITGVYPGAILQNFRSLQANETGLQEKQVHSSGINYDFQQSIRMLFLNAGISYDQTVAQTLLSTEVADNLQKIIMLPYKNSQQNMVLTAGFSKYLFRLKSTISLKSRLNRLKYVQLINQQLLPFRSDALSISGNVLKKLFETVSVSYQPAGVWSTTRLQEGKSQGGLPFSHRAFRLDQHLLLGITTIKKLYIETTARHSYSSSSGNKAVRYFFLDTQLRYSYAPKRMDINLSITNLFNLQEYILYNISANQLVTDQYHIRGRMAMLRLEWYL